VDTAASFANAIISTRPITVRSTTDEHTHSLTTKGKVAGRLVGGNQDSIATGAGWALPSFDGAILLLEAFYLRLGHIDRQLTVLLNSGIIRHIAGVAVGQYTQCGAASDPTTPNALQCTEIDILRERLGQLNVPILGGLPIGHGNNPIAAPIGTMATLNADAGTLTVESGVS
jgi:muramoyltetrapeptide carboxypeptidase